MGELDERVARLEREVRVYRVGAVVGTACALLGGGIQHVTAEAGPVGTTLKAPLRVVDTQGRELVKVEEFADAPTLWVNGRKNKSAVMIQARSEGGTVLAKRPDGGIGAWLSVDGRAGSVMVMDGAEPYPVAVLGSTDADGPASGYVRLANVEKKSVVEVGVKEDKGGGMTIYDPLGKETASLQFDVGGGLLTLRNRAGKPTFVMPDP